MRGAAKCVVDVTVSLMSLCHWCHPVMMSLSLTSLWITDVTDASVSLMSLCHCGSLMSLCHWCHCVTASLCVTDVTMSLMLLCHWCHCITDVTMSAEPYKSLCSYHILISSVIYLSDVGLTLETSALKLFTMANLCYQPVDDPKLPYYTLPLTQHHSFFRNVYYWTVAQCNMEMKQYFPFIWWSSLIIYILVTPAVLQVKVRFMWMESLYMEMLLGLIVIL